MRNIIQEILNFRKTCAKWIPKMLTTVHKKKRLKKYINLKKKERFDEPSVSFLEKKL